MRELSEYERGFLSGLVDGEGSMIIHWDKQKESLEVKMSISNNSVELLREAERIIGGGSFATKNNPRYGHSYEFRVHARTLRWLLPQLKFYTREKEIRRLAVIDYLSKIPDRANQHLFSRQQREVIWRELFSKVHLDERAYIPEFAKPSS